MKTLIIIAVLLTVSFRALGGEISDYHFKHARDKLGDYRKSRSHEEVASTNHGITEIGIERSPCYGTCPIYTFVIKSDGTFRYKGQKYVEREGDYTGTVPVWYFHQLAQFIRDSGYMELEDGYTRMVTDNPTTYTMVVMNGKRKTVSNYADAGPTKLWAIEQLIDDLMSKAKWSGPKTTTVLGTWCWNVTSNRLCSVASGDFWWEWATENSSYFVPLNGAKAAVVTGQDFERIDAKYLDRVVLSKEKIAGTALKSGAIVVFLTGKGEAGKLQVVGYKGSHEFDFPEAAAHVTADWKQLTLSRPEVPTYHLQVRWTLLR